VSRPAAQFTADQILDAVRAWVGRYGSPPTTKDWEPSRALAAGQCWRVDRYRSGVWPSLGMVQRRFGTFNEAIRQAGFEPRPARAGSGAGGESARDRILRAIVEWTRRYGAPPTQSDWDPGRARRTGQPWRAARFQQGDWPRLQTVRRHFGSLNEAIEAVGLRARHPGQHGRTELGDRGHNLRVLAAVGGAAPDLGTAVREVASARRTGDKDHERDALLALASVALTLADDIGWDLEAIPA
jgi:Homing endonuclease associated repeat